MTADNKDTLHIKQEIEQRNRLLLKLNFATTQLRKYHHLYIIKLTSEGSMLYN